MDWMIDELKVYWWIEGLIDLSIDELIKWYTGGLKHWWIEVLIDFIKYLKHLGFNLSK